jgi:hypothetical protein
MDDGSLGPEKVVHGYPDGVKINFVTWYFFQTFFNVSLLMHSRIKTRRSFFLNHVSACIFLNFRSPDGQHMAFTVRYEDEVIS